MFKLRNIAALLAISALLLAGWVSATHWHFHGVLSGEKIAAEGNCCSATHETAACYPAAETNSHTSGLSGAHSTHLGDGCSLCDFLASHVFGLAMVYEFAGMLAELQLTPEPLIDSPTSLIRSASCRGPPLAA